MKYKNNIELNIREKICVFCLLMVFSGIIGWIYEFIFYYFNDGKFSFQGGNFMPWINIYAIGSILIVISTIKIIKKPYLVFLISMLTTGILEYFSGLFVFKVLNTRYWDYNNEILNFGNINGFVCLRSVLIFGLAALVLMYKILPFIIKIVKKTNKKTILTMSILLFSIIIFDEIYNLFLYKILNLPNATTIYKNWNIK